MPVRARRGRRRLEGSSSRTSVLERLLAGHRALDVGNREIERRPDRRLSAAGLGAAAAVAARAAATARRASSRPEHVQCCECDARGAHHNVLLIVFLAAHPVHYGRRAGAFSHKSMRDVDSRRDSCVSATLTNGSRFAWTAAYSDSIPSRKAAIGFWEGEWMPLTGRRMRRDSPRVRRSQFVGLCLVWHLRCCRRWRRPMRARRPSACTTGSPACRRPRPCSPRWRATSPPAAPPMPPYTAMQNRAFYDVTLKNFATPWTNRDQTVFAPLNDYVATVIGMVRDDVAVRSRAVRRHPLRRPQRLGVPALLAGEQRPLRRTRVAGRRPEGRPGADDAVGGQRPAGRTRRRA